MWGVIAGVVQIVYLILKNKFERDEETKKKREALYEESKSAIKSMDTSKLNLLIGKLRK